MKTALKQYIQHLEEKYPDLIFQYPFLTSCSDLFLEEEKEQIERAYNSGLAHEFGCMYKNKYYNETFK